MPHYLTFISLPARIFTPFFENIHKHTCLKNKKTKNTAGPHSSTFSPLPRSRMLQVKMSFFFSSNQIIAARCRRSCRSIAVSLYSAQLIISCHSHPAHIAVGIQHDHCDNPNKKKRSVHFLSSNPPTHPRPLPHPPPPTCNAIRRMSDEIRSHAIWWLPYKSISGANTQKFQFIFSRNPPPPTICGVNRC